MKHRVLIIMSDRQAADLLGESLRREGDFEHTIVGQADTGLDQIGEKAFDCVVIDGRRAAGDALEVVAKVKEKWRHLPVVFLVDGEATRIALSALQHGAYLCVVQDGAYVVSFLRCVREALAKNETARTIDRLARGVFIGRAFEKQILNEAVDGCLESRGRLCLLEGEAGVGKTSLAKQVDAYAAGRDLRVVWARCHQREGAPPYWLWMQILRAALQDSSVDDLRDDLGSGWRAVAQVLPEIAERLSEQPNTSSAAPEPAQILLFDAVTSFLINSARRRPTLIVLDDVHWADRSSLLLLEYLGRELANASLVVLCAFRDGDLLGNEPAAKAIAQLRRYGRMLRLQGLTEGETRELLAAVSHQKVPATFAQALYENTGGNPFFIEEILQLLIEEGVLFHDGVRWTARANPEQMPIPRSTSEILKRRIAPVSADCRRALAIGAVVGRQFSVDAVAHLSGEASERICELLDRAAEAGLIARVRGPVRDFVFSQALVRSFLYDELRTSVRAELHRRFGEYLEVIYAGEIDAHVALLAHHFLRTSDTGSQAKAHRYALRAAAQASVLPAHEDAARHFETALKAMAPGVDAPQRLEVLLQASESWWRAGDTKRARELAMLAVETARVLRSPDGLARAALAHAGLLQGFGVVVFEEDVVRILEEALDGLEERDSGLRARLMGRLAEELTFSNQGARRQALARQALEMARRSGDAMVLALVLRNMHWALWTPEEVNGRLQLADELVHLAVASRDPSMEFEGHLFRCLAMIELGEMVAIREELDVCSRLALRLRQPYNSWLVASARVCAAFSQGNLKEIPDLAEKARALGEQAQSPNAALFHDVQLAHLHWQRGQFSELMTIVARIAEKYPLVVNGLQTGLAEIYSEQGLEKETADLLDVLAVDDFAGLPRDVTWTMGLTFLAEACYFLGDAPRATKLYELLKPFEGRIVVLAPVVAYGPACHYLGLLAATMGRSDDARRHFESALAVAGRIGMSQSLARTQIAYARLLLDVEPEDERAHKLLEEARHTGQELQLPIVRDRAKSLLDHGLHSDCDRTDLERRRIKVRVRREGDYYIWSRPGKRSLIKRSKGMDQIYCLLSHPGTWIHVGILRCIDDGVLPSVPADVDSIEGIDGILGTAFDPLMDSKTIDALNGELEKLERDIAEALRENLDRAKALLKRKAAILDELNRARGPGGKKKSHKNPFEGDRLAVRSSLERGFNSIARYDEMLASHLSRYIVRGYECRYAPDSLSIIIIEL